MFLQMALFHFFLSTVYVYLVLLIQSSVDGYLGWFHVLAIVSGGAMNTELHVSLWISVFIFLDKCLGEGLLDIR